MELLKIYCSAYDVRLRRTFIYVYVFVCVYMSTADDTELLRNPDVYDIK